MHTREHTQCNKATMHRCGTDFRAVTVVTHHCGQVTLQPPKVRLCMYEYIWCAMMLLRVGFSFGSLIPQTLCRLLQV